ncbi:hypothetical protein NN3_43320 [Nocardia neocaledoniensis NBRC 108232]|uniref:Lipoprotein n=1 Tax=Nocardia neocaledoniensis TaxID=236511 RepID=A0A317N2U9_9NOCA|nr:hypothetical protein [Nocardia neocaledoniensis]PWV68726.1 hypothetical protein DFR69_11745 [Nocardia neocaledoniensis]GEM33325.1 hypothetical protein NN3_43320 [Nocardia neocaledoniensis NBRC 108232]
MSGGDSGGNRRARMMKSRSVTSTLPAVVAVALVSAGCGAGVESTSHRATTTTRPAVTTTKTTTTVKPTTTTSGTAQPTAVGVCVDTSTDTRVADEKCDTSDDRYKTFWYRHTDTFLYPAVGAAIALAAGTFVRPSGSGVYDRGVPTAGGKVLRGGLGQRPDSSGGGSGGGGSAGS